MTQSQRVASSIIVILTVALAFSLGLLLHSATGLRLIGGTLLAAACVSGGISLFVFRKR